MLNSYCTKSKVNNRKKIPMISYCSFSHCKTEPTYSDFDLQMNFGFEHCEHAIEKKNRG
jgi:hypothetical protein